MLVSALGLPMLVLSPVPAERLEDGLTDVVVEVDLVLTPVLL